MRKGEYFYWGPEVRVVYGARRAAVHDFQTGAVYSVNGAAAALLRALEDGRAAAALTPSEHAFVSHLVELGLGHFSLSSSMPAEGLPAEPPPHPLEFLWLELNGACNLGCSHCYAGSQNPALYPAAPAAERGGPALTFDQWADVLRQAADLGCRAVQFIGGETLLDRRLLGLIDRARDLGFTFIEVYTNGTLLTERVARALAERGVRVAVSLHGTTAPVHDAAVGLPGSFGRATAGLRRLRDHGVPFRVAGVATRDNQDDILQLTDVARRAGAEAAHIDVVRGIGGGAARDLLPDDPAALAQSWLTGPAFVADRAVFEHNQLWNACWAGKLTITAAGDALPCVMGRSERVGNVGQESLAEILAGPRLRALWGLTKDEVAVCRDCEYRYACGDCRPLALAEGDLHGAMPRCTYDPTRGDWGQLGTDRRDPGPAPEDDAPRIALVPARRAVDGGLITSTPGATKSSLAPRPARGRSRNVLFGCDPDRALPDPPPVSIPLQTIKSGNFSSLPLS